MGQDEELRLGRRGVGKKRWIQARLPDETEGRADCPGNEVLQSVIYGWDWFNWRDSPRRGSDAIYQGRFYTCLRALAFRVVEEKRRPIETPPRRRRDWSSLWILCVLISVNIPGIGDLFWARSIETRDCEIRGGEHERALVERSIKVGRPLSNRPR